MRLELRLILLIVVLFSSISPLNSQEDSKQDPLVIELDKIISDDKRDEIQRYFGYEDLLFRYLTLPYDLSSNTNQQGRYVDLGFALFMLLPLVFLGLVYKHRKLFYTSLVVFFLFLSLCLSYSFQYTQFHGQVNNHGTKWQSFIANSDKSVIESITTGIFNISYYASRPIHVIGNQISGNRDHFTYPILILLFIGSLWLLVHRIKLSEKGQFVAAVFIPFSFLWLALSSGIIWYGFLIIPLGLTSILHFCSNDKFNAYPSFGSIKNIIILFLLIWITMCWVGRISNINTMQTGENTANIGKGILDNNTFQYSTSLISAKEARSKSYGNINDALEKINSNNALIYQIGTFFAFDIKNNTERLFQDNTLPQFFWLVDVLKEKEKIIAALKASNFKYILIDLYTHTLDKTPEKSLTKKYQLLLNTIYKNPSVQLLATDRVIEIKQNDGTKSKVSEVFGENILTFGSYAIYEIL
ncbi:MAG: hypothetical protein ACI9FN_002572 [Saprospiraceae bacterium]|jgi:hypothetical protein